MCIHYAFGFRDDILKVVYPFAGVSKEEYPTAVQQYLSAEGAAGGHLLTIETFLAQGGTDFVAGQAVTVGDFHLWEMCDQHELMSTRAGLPSTLARYPLVQAWHSRFKALPELASYFASDAYTLPCNNKTANFR
jgi:glutathione S-transferase